MTCTLRDRSDTWTGPARVFSQASRAARGPVGIPHWMRMVRGAYLEIPGLHLTPSQVQRLWGLDAESCDEVLKAFLELRFLERMPDGGFVLARGNRR